MGGEASCPHRRGEGGASRAKQCRGIGGVGWSSLVEWSSWRVARGIVWGCRWGWTVTVVTRRHCRNGAARTSPPAQITRALPSGPGCECAAPTSPPRPPPAAPSSGDRPLSHPPPLYARLLAVGGRPPARPAVTRPWPPCRPWAAAGPPPPAGQSRPAHGPTAVGAGRRAHRPAPRTKWVVAANHVCGGSTPPARSNTGPKPSNGWVGPVDRHGGRKTGMGEGGGGEADVLASLLHTEVRFAVVEPGGGRGAAAAGSSATTSRAAEDHQNAKNQEDTQSDSRYVALAGPLWTGEAVVPTPSVGIDKSATPLQARAQRLVHAPA